MQIRCSWRERDRQHVIKLHEIKFMLRVTVREQPARLLDKDLRTVCLAAPDTVDWNRVSFVMEVGGGETKFAARL